MDSLITDVRLKTGASNEDEEPVVVETSTTEIALTRNKEKVDSLSQEGSTQRGNIIISPKFDLHKNNFDMS